MCCRDLEAARRAAMIDRLARAHAAGEHTGIMIALVPRAEDAQRLATAGGEPAEELHVTLFYFGDASAMPVDAREVLVEAVRYTAERYGPLRGKAFGAAVFNPTSDEPALVLNVGGDAVDAFRRELEAVLWPSPDQHRPWAAHMTLAYLSAPLDYSMPLDALAARMGPVVFDRVRIAFAGHAVDIPFVELEAVAAARNARAIFEAQRAGATFAAHRGVQPAAKRRLAAARSAAPVVRVDGDQITFPVVAFVEGVREPANSEGPELFLASEFEAALESALAMPVVFQHPTKRGEYVSIQDGPHDAGTGVPVGIVTAAEFDENRMIVQVTAWLSKLRQAGPEAAALADAIVRGEQTEVSIGHWSRMLPRAGEYEGEPFIGVHVDVQFDHLALLPIGTPGACSLADGCGTART